jgi:hypothetical protein
MRIKWLLFDSKRELSRNLLKREKEEIFSDVILIAFLDFKRVCAWNQIVNLWFIQRWSIYDKKFRWKMKIKKAEWEMKEICSRENWKFFASI